MEQTAMDQFDVAKAQQENIELDIVQGWLAENAVIPDWVEILFESEAVKVYWRQKDSLFLRDEIVYRRTPDCKEQMILPKAQRSHFLKMAHTGMTRGHLGIRRKRFQIRRGAYWVGCSQDVKRFCQQCSECCQYRRGQPPRQEPLQRIPCGEAWEILGVDLTGPHVRS